ncbi:MAG: heavy-metal-associated domain-containing protein [Bacteroidetes bacterium]|nr:heavy-metal-associated domain-containing protein [Bacteroidota bacterium]
METVIFQVDGMSCQHCKKSVENKLEALDGVIDFEVSLEAAEAKVKFDELKLTAQQIEDAFKDSNYQVQIK